MSAPHHSLRKRDVPAGALAVLATAVLASLAGLALVSPSSSARISCFGETATIVRGGGNDVIHGTGGADVIYAGGGNDTIMGGRGKDKICGGPGNDKIYGNRGSDALDGGSGRDRVFGNTGNDRVEGGPGNRDYVDGGPGDDKEVAGGPGNYDVVIGNSGVDRIDGGPGEHDVASYVTSSVSISVNLGNGSVGGDAGERLKGIEDVMGGSGNDRLTGSSAHNRLDGGPGNDRLRAVGRGDIAFGGPGSDTCMGRFASENSCGENASGRRAVTVELFRSIDGSSSLTIGGTNRSDLVTVEERGGSLLAIGSGGTEIVPGGAASGCRRVSKAQVLCRGRAERVMAAMEGGNDTFSLIGTSPRTSATIDGGAGSDDLSGGAGRDVLYGGQDRDPDALAGGGGDDVLFGINTSHPRKDSGAARMFGGGGNDLLVGGQPCDGDVFDGGPGKNDSASFARVHNSGTTVRAKIGGAVTDPDVGARCRAGRIDGSVEKIEGSNGPDRLYGDGSANALLGRGGDDLLDGNGGRDSCYGGGGRDRAIQCEEKSEIP